MKLCILNIFLCFSISIGTFILQLISTIGIAITTSIVIIRFYHYMKERKKEKELKISQGNMI